jgi:ppGpp synthetase/RelA/SpoT-type nucleotidyltranferase
MSDLEKPTYAAAVAGLDRLATMLVQALDDLLADKVVLHSIGWRVKTQASADRKLLLEADRFASYDDIHDMLGIRVITLFESDLDAAADEICRVVAADPSRSGNKARKHSPTEFGYSSQHFVGKLDPARLQLPEFARYQTQIVEVQLRTILQHAWAEIEHDLGYKPQRPISPALRRRFSQLAALVELADDQFVSLRRKIEENEAAAGEALAADRPVADEEGMDVTQLSAFIQQSEAVSLLDNTIAAYFDRAVLPRGRNYREFVGQVADSCRSMGWSSLDQLADALSNNDENVKKYAHALSERLGASDANVTVPNLRPGFCLIYLVRMLSERSS